MESTNDDEDDDDNWAATKPTRLGIASFVEKVLLRVVLCVVSHFLIK